MRIPPRSGIDPEIANSSDGGLEQILKAQLSTIEHEEFVRALEEVENLLLQQPQNRTLQRILSVVSELAVLRSKASILPRLRVLAGRAFLDGLDLDAIRMTIQNDSIIRAISMLMQVIAVLRKRSDLIVPT